MDYYDKDALAWLYISKLDIIGKILVIINTCSYMIIMLFSDIKKILKLYLNNK